MGAAEVESDKEEGEVMDTPDRSKNNQITPSIAKFEESPVFNFLNSLSPIKPVKSMRISQTINPLSFASLPAVFTSPHVRESRFLPRHQLSDPSKPEFSYDDMSNVNIDATKKLDVPPENLNPKTFDSVEGVNQINRDNEATSCGWENLISDPSSLLIFESPNDTDSYKKSTDAENGFANSLCLLGSDERVGEGCAPAPYHLSTQPGEGVEMTEENFSEEKDYEHLPGVYRGMRRRCLVFEMSGAARRTQFDESLGSKSSTLLQPDAHTSSNDQKLGSNKTGNDSSRCVLPGIGLHLNALATVNNDSSASGRLLIGCSSSVNLYPLISAQELLSNVPVVSSDIEIDGAEDTVVSIEDACETVGYVANEDIGQSSPRKKRSRVEQSGDGEACKRCNCKKSKCLKLYCECFAAGVYCVEPCACIDCFNKPVHEDTVLATRKQIESRNPLAFAPKVIRGPDSLAEPGDDASKTPASARHKRGCNCKKSGCLKKYCECYQGGVGCSINCRCEGCKNVFGKKDGSQAEVDEEDNESEQNIDPLPLATPRQPGRKCIQLPLYSDRRPPRSSFPTLGSSSRVLGKSSLFQPFDNQLESVVEDEMPAFLQGGLSPISGIKSSSPNRKRVSPPHGATGLRSSRKLILQSIPSFPSLTPNQ